MAKGKLITVSYRLPYTLTASRSKLILSPSAGGLATALTSYLSSTQGTDNEQAAEFESIHWIGVSDLSKQSYERVCHQDRIKKGGMVLHPHFLNSVMKEKFYNGFCNSTLWPLFLYFPSYVSYDPDHYQQYTEANRLMCEHVMALYEPGDTIWIHDYHWMLLPAMLRSVFPDARIGFFLHIPFPNFELFRLLPRNWRSALLTGVLGADVVGFQTSDFADYFVDCSRSLLPHARIEGNTISIRDHVTGVKNFPISINYRQFHEAAQSVQNRQAIKKIRERIGMSKIIVSVDRLDYTKALFNRLEGYALFLKQTPEYHSRVSYILLMVPSRESIPKYKENKLAIEALVSRINGQYGTFGWTPIVYQYQRMDFKHLVALYGASDIALIVSSRDGMNLVAKEYVACRPSSDGVLILSETAGSSGELRDAILVNANDRQEIADAINRALEMTPKEQELRIDRMQNQIKTHDVSHWAKTLFQSIKRKTQVKSLTT